MRYLVILGVTLTLICRPAVCEVFKFGFGDDVFEMEFVTIGDPGNPGDERTFGEMGSVDYEYQTSKFEVSCFMQRTAGLDGAYDDFPFARHEFCLRGENFPANDGQLEAAQLVNWLNTTSGYPPAYRLNNSDAGSFQARLVLWQPGEPEYDPGNPARNSLAKFGLPTADEWHKAAYFDPSEKVYRLYSTGDDPPDPVPVGGGTAPNTAVYDVQFNEIADVDRAGGLSAYGTMAQTGNMDEWEESLWNLSPDADPSGHRSVSRMGGIEGLRFQTAIESRTLMNNPPAGIRVVAIEQPLPIPGDTNADDVVNFADFLALSSNFDEQGTWSMGDFTADGWVKFEDFLILSANFEANGQAAAVPEPSSLALLCLALCWLGALRQRRAA